MVVAAQAPAAVGAEVAPQEPDRPEAVPLADVLQFVPEEVVVPGGAAADRDDGADGDGVRTVRDGTADPEPVVVVPPEAHGLSTALR